MITTEEHPSAYAIDRFLLGEGPPELRAHLEQCESCGLKIAALASEDEAILRDFPTPASIGLRALPARPARVRRRALPIALALAASILLFVAIMSPRFDDTDTRVKGESTVELLVRRDDRSFPYAGEKLRAGDTLAFRYTTERRFMVVIGVEASGKAQVHVATAIDPGQNRIAKDGVRLDAYDGAERVHVFLSDEALDSEALLRDLELGRMSERAEHHSWLIEKEHR
jgi:hypothetical protein